jgi:hypothetical protein
VKSNAASSNFVPTKQEALNAGTRQIKRRDGCALPGA